MKWNINSLDILKKHKEEGLSCKEIAKLFNKTVPSVYYKLYSAYEILAKELVESGEYDESLRNIFIKFKCKCGCDEYIEKFGTPYNMVKEHCIKSHEGFLGKGSTWTKEQKEKFRIPKSHEHKENISRGRMGYKPREESIEKWKRSMEKKGFDHLRTEEYRSKMSNIMSGKKKSDIHKESISIFMKGRPYNNYKRGFYESEKAGKIFYRSSLELKAYILLDYDPKVDIFTIEPVRIPYFFNDEKRYYIPDIKVCYSSGDNNLIEVKLMKELNWEINKVKFVAAREFCRKNQMLFKIMTDTYLEKAIAKRGELLEHLNSYLGQDNKQPSSSKESKNVDEKVQRLISEDDSTNKLNTSALDLILVT